jgi:fructuronate reductase
VTLRLSEATVDRLPDQVERPGYDRTATSQGVVHLGIGAFHRAHQAVVFDDLLRSGDMRWGICGASLRSPQVRDQMVPQDCLYSLRVSEGSDERVRLIGAVRDVIVAPEIPHALVAAMAAETTNIVTLTVTEKGYKLDPASGALIEQDPDLAADLASLASPRTAPGYIVAALAERRARRLRPFTAISCDNLPHNGRRLEAAVLAIALRHDPGLRDWIEAEGAFPETMVDRIVPATDDTDIDALAARTGLVDRAMVKTEPFLQWVIEDRFAGPRPDFEAVGVQVTSDVAPWEEAKLRLLNGAHSGLAYLGGLAGVDFVHEFVAQSEGRGFVESLWNEAEATLSPPPGLDVASYRQALMARFANSALQHRTRQIAMDGSQKLPQRLLATIAIRLDRGQSIEALGLAVAAWMQWQGGRTDAGETFIVDDPLASETARRLAGASNPADRVRALLAIDAIFPPALAAHWDFQEVVTRHLSRLSSDGARRTLAEFAAGDPV